MTTRGGCLCGEVRFAASGESMHPTLCHCESCRRSSGAPAVAWTTFARGGFRFTEGTPTEHRSSPGVTRTFCSRCGSALTYARDELPDEIDVVVAALDEPADAPPADETWCDDRLPWMDRVGTLPRFPRAREEKGTKPKR